MGHLGASIQPTESSWIGTTSVPAAAGPPVWLVVLSERVHHKSGAARTLQAQPRHGAAVARPCAGDAAVQDGRELRV